MKAQEFDYAKKTLFYALGTHDFDRFIVKAESSEDPENGSYYQEFMLRIINCSDYDTEKLQNLLTWRNPASCAGGSFSYATCVVTTEKQGNGINTFFLVKIRGGLDI